MKKIIFLLATILFLPGYSFAGEDGDFEAWHTDSVSYQFIEGWKAQLIQEIRFGESKGLYYEHTEGNINFTVAEKWLDLGAGYRLAMQDRDGDWKYDSRPFLDTTFKMTLHEFTFNDRNRFEFRALENAKDDIRYRNKLEIRAPEMTKFALQPFVGNEIFVRLTGNFDAVENRLYGGVGFNTLWKLKGDLYYLWRTRDRDNTWIDSNVLGTNLKMAF